MVRKRTPGTGVIVGRVAGRTRHRAPRVRLPRIGAGWVRGAAVAFALALLTTGGLWLYSSPLLSIEDVSVQGNTAISDELARSVADLEGSSVIFTEFDEAEERLAALPLVFCSYPITPASGILHTLAGLKAYGVTTFQAEDEIAAVCAAIGASYAGALGVTSSSGPGMSLKTEGLDLAISTELPLVVINTQRAGPSTGMPTKTEQADLLQAVYGRHGDSALVVLAARSPADCFEAAIDATRLAIKYMTPVVLLSDNYIANASEPWNLPDVDKMARFPARFREDPKDFHPFERDPATLARPWAVPGTPGLEHRIGGLERDAVSGNISYDPSNHQRMTELRAAKIAGIAKDIPAQTIDQGPDGGPMVVVGWGSTYGPISRAVGNLLSEGVQVSHVHLRHIWPLPRNLGELLGGFERVLVPEMNMGQLVKLLRSELLVPAEGLNKVSGKPFMIAEIEAAVRDALGGLR